MLRYLLIDIKIMTRIPLSVFFSLAFPVIMMIIIMTSYGNVEIGNGLNLIDKYFLISVGLGVLPLTLISFPIWLANRVEDGSLKRLTFLGVKAKYVIASDVLTHIIVGILTLFVCLIFAYFLYGLHLPSLQSFVAFFIQYILILITYLLVGAVLALSFPVQQVLLPLGMTLMFAMFLFCGVFGQTSDLPEVMQQIGNYIPMKYAMNDFFYIWRGDVFFNQGALILCFAYMIISVLAIGILWHFRKNKL